MLIFPQFHCFEEGKIKVFHLSLFMMGAIYRDFQYLSSPRRILNKFCPSYNPHHQGGFCQLLTPEAEEVEGLALLETWNTENLDLHELQYHPLSESLILEIVMRYLDPEDLRSSRLVCQQWNEEVNRAVTGEFPIRLRSCQDIASFLKLIDDDNVQFPVRHLEIFNHAKLSHEDKTKLFQSIGHLITTLILQNIDFYHPFISLPGQCPNLELLVLKFRRMFSTVQRRSMWRYPFKSLKHVLIDLSGYKVTIANNIKSCQEIESLVMLLVDLSPSIISLAIRRSGPEIMESISTGLEKRPAVLNQLEYLELHGFEASLKPWAKMEFSCLKTLHILKLEDCVTTETFSRILQATSNTLTTLMIDGYSQGSTGFQLYFPCEMKSLEILIVFEDLSMIHGGSVSLLKRLPNVRVFCFSGNEQLWMRYRPQFWQALFHDLNGLHGGIVNENLVFFKSYVFIIDVEIFHKITTSFPGLRVLEIAIDGTMLRDVIFGMKDFQLEELSIVYYETPMGILDFDSALTGISIENCQRLLYNEIQDYTPSADQVSLADLKHLRILTIAYKAQNQGFITLDHVAVHGIILASSVSQLCLKNFKIDEQFMLKMMKKLPLERFIIQPGRIRYREPSTLGLDRILKQFPHVKFLCSRF